MSLAAVPQPAACAPIPSTASPQACKGRVRARSVGARLSGLQRSDYRLALTCTTPWPTRSGWQHRCSTTGCQKLPSVLPGVVVRGELRVRVRIIGWTLSGSGDGDREGDEDILSLRGLPKQTFHVTATNMSQSRRLNFSEQLPKGR